jgi:hypothetical protein
MAASMRETRVMDPSSALTARLIATVHSRVGWPAEHGAGRRTRARRRSRRLVAGLAAGAVAAGLAHPGSTFATTCRSVPGATSFADGRYDAVNPNGVLDPTGHAPDITSVDVAITAACQLSIGATIEGHTSPADSLSDGEAIVFSLDVDANRATGAPPAGADRQITTYGNTGAPDVSRLGRWSGGGFSYVDLPAPLAWGRQTVSFAALGVTARSAVKITAAAVFVAGGTSWFDRAPEGDTAFAVPVVFAGAFPWPDGPQRHRVACTVPDVRGMAAWHARRRLRAAGCRARFIVVLDRRRRRGTVISTSPRAGRTTWATVTVRIAAGGPIRPVA